MKSHVTISHPQYPLFRLAIVAIVLFILYQWMYTPLLEKNKMLRQEITENRIVLYQIQQIHHAMLNIHHPTQSEMLSIEMIVRMIKQKIDNAQLADSLVSLETLRGDEIAMQFHDASFDDLISMLIHVTTSESVEVETLKLLRGTASGKVNATILLKAAS